MLAAGGTGGHLFPAQALAEELGRRGLAVDLITDMRGDRYGMGFPARKVYQVPAATLAGANPLTAARTVLTLAKGVRAAGRILAEVKPGAVIGFGGYPSFPPLVAASLKGIPTALHEQNAVLGRANRMLARRVTAIATSFETVKLLEGTAKDKARFTGNPVRDAVIEWARVPYEPSGPGEPFHLLVFGGSQGARFFSETVPPALAQLPEPMRQRLRVVQQARPEDKDGVIAAYRAGSAPIAATVESFFQNLPELMAASHLVIARAGASSVAELTVLGRPSILVPLPHALDNDQLANATRLAEAGGAICLEQQLITPERLATHIAELMAAPDQLAAGAEAARSQGRPDAVQRLADLVIGLMSGVPGNG
ncbi:MAG: undecaprenyldiphospho-muramoylpentapeptide beta-N-acetylglucosaminyltransferase [Hyphomicrobiaceae bacterium]|nr:undecaprenyldiphospho-muramoylpentapeptide beta-N-acetylglucosaminyltransferase [Hyphomicrobiaceae bacterium]